MTKGIIIFICLSILLLGISCRNESERVQLIHQKAEDLLEQNPDSALVILSEINDAKKLSKKLYYQHYLVQIRAKYKSYKNITADTLIFTIRDYYLSKNDVENAAMASYYSGRVYEEQKNYEKALQQFLVVESALEKSDNYNLKGLCHGAIGKMYYNQYLKNKAIPHYKLSEKYYFLAGNFKNQIIANKFIANCLLLTEKKDSAIYYYNNALTIADKYGYKRQQSEVHMNLGVAYRELENFEQAEIQFKKALEFSSDSIYSAKLANNFAKIYVLEEKYDLAIEYLQKALSYLPQKQNNSTTAAIYTAWTNLEEKRGNYREALDKHKLYSKHLARILDKNKNAALLDIEAKYDYQLVENQNKQLLIEQQRILIISLALLLALVVIVFFLFRRLAQNKKRWMETEQKVRQLKKLAREFDEKEESFRSILIQHFDILKKAALLERYLKEDERKKGEPLIRKFNEVVYGQKELDWEVIYQKLNQISNGFFGQFKNQFPQLDESEFRICCLLYVDFNNTEIAIILNYSTNTVQTKKSLIRKKLNIKTYGNIHHFMKESMEI